MSPFSAPAPPSGSRAPPSGSRAPPSGSRAPGVVPTQSCYWCLRSRPTELTTMLQSSQHRAIPLPLPVLTTLFLKCCAFGLKASQRPFWTIPLTPCLLSKPCSASSPEHCFVWFVCGNGHQVQVIVVVRVCGELHREWTMCVKVLFC